MSLDDDRIEELLSKGHLSGAAYDRIEERVLARTAAPRARGRGHWAALAAAVCGAGGLILILSRDIKPVTDAGFRAKGEPAFAGAGSVELACSQEGRACRPGDTLMFLVDSGALSGYMSARAVRLEPPSEERVWFFPTEGGEVPYIAAGQGTVVASQGVRLDREKLAGSYRVDVWFSASKPERRVPPVDEERVVSLRLTLEP
jgi:hypothetical protein